ncbi:MAG: Uncharacterized protein FD123_518 [Bacteroidetes bacterium]|nr:MAG: Uncharacterized protein FD123_518 [Bacteroidota bacterium]
MNKFSLLFSPVIVFSGFAYGQNTPADGNWKSQYVKLQNTGEAQYMIRMGDIDNLGFGWPANFSPFSGRSTPPHNFPWIRNTKDTLGFDMIQLPSSMRSVENACGGDGYSYEYDSTRFKYGRTQFPFHIPVGIPKETVIQSASIQMFVDDFQSPVFCSKFEATLNGRSAPFISNAINALNQTGPIGKLITIKVPADFLDSLKAPVVTLEIDDKTTGANDGFAIDFIKLQINPSALKAAQKGTIRGMVYDPATGKPVADATLTLSDGTQVKTDAKGMYTFSAIAGLAIITVKANGFPDKSFSADVISGETTEQNLDLTK